MNKQTFGDEFDAGQLAAATAKSFLEVLYLETGRTRLRAPASPRVAPWIPRAVTFFAEAAAVGPRTMGTCAMGTEWWKRRVAVARRSTCRGDPRKTTFFALTLA